MTSRRRLRGTTSLKRRTTPAEPEPVRPEDYATIEDPICVCHACRHHTSSWIGGACTTFVLDEESWPRWCGCDCREHLEEPT